MDAEDPLFILYTSGSTGKPKGVVHSTAGYLLHTSLTHKYIFDYHPGDVYCWGEDIAVVCNDNRWSQSYVYCEEYCQRQGSESGSTGCDAEDPDDFCGCGN